MNPQNVNLNSGNETSSALSFEAPTSLYSSMFAAVAAIAVAIMA